MHASSRLDAGGESRGKIMSPRRSIARVLSSELNSESSMATRACFSASPPLSNSRPNSVGQLADDCTLDTLSSQGARAVKGSPRSSLSLVRQARRTDSFRALKARQRLSATAHQRSPSHASQDVNDWSLPKLASSANPGEAGATAGVGHGGVSSRPGLRSFHSSPVALPNRSAPRTPQNTEAANTQPWHLQLRNSHQSHDMMGVESVSGLQSQVSGLSWHNPDEMFRQPETNPVTEHHLTNEVRAIYAGLVLVERKSMEINKQISEGSIGKDELSPAQWKTLTSLYRTLIHEHLDFLLASQHPAASPGLKGLGAKYSMPDRLWRYGIHAFLELLRSKLPASLEWMVSFIYFAYSTMALLHEAVPEFTDTWVECLGDIARYGAVVEEDARDRETWIGMARYWYGKDAERSPDNGRAHHHLALVSQLDVLGQLYHYSKALVCVHPFPAARERILGLVNPLLNGQPGPIQHPMVTTFVAAHGFLYTRGSTEQFVAVANQFLSYLQQNISHLGQQAYQGTLMTSCNIAAILEYGADDAVLAPAFAQKQHSSIVEAYTAAMEEWMSVTPSIDNFMAGGAAVSAQTVSQMWSHPAFLGASLASHTLSVMLDRLGDTTMYASVHISLAFIWCLSLHPPAMRQLEMLIPWTKLAAFLNHLLHPNLNFWKIESEQFPLLDDGPSQQLPEDRLIRGHSWSQVYYPDDFFEEAPAEYDRPPIEEPSLVIPRRHRCLWLGVRIARFGRWLTFSHTTRQFAATQLAHGFAPMAETCGHLNSRSSNQLFVYGTGFGGVVM